MSEGDSNLRGEKSTKPPVRFVWDTSALLNTVELDQDGYSAASSLLNDLMFWTVQGRWEIVVPASAVFELRAAAFRKQREGHKIDHLMIPPWRTCSIDLPLIQEATKVMSLSGFEKLRGGDLIVACIAKLENAHLVTLDKDFEPIRHCVHVINLLESKQDRKYRDELRKIFLSDFWL